MKVLICVDDTDNIDTGSTGEVADLIVSVIKDNDWGRVYPITRHQLLIHPDIPYTSHNSSMCFAADIQEECLAELKQRAVQLVREHSVEGSDPGLCILEIDKLTDPERLIRFGRRAKQVVVSKQEAYELAAALDIHLSEHGGSGEGIIGALAGVGLRLTGNDGRIKGKFTVEAANNVATVRDIYKQTKIDLVRDLAGNTLQEQEAVKVGDRIKAVFLDHQSVLLVQPTKDSSAPWELCPDKVLKNY